MTQTLTLIRGLPGSGKSTIARALAAQGGVHVEADQFMVDANGAYNFDPTRLGAVHKACFEATADAMSRGQDVFVANTFTELWELATYRQLALAEGATLVIIECKAQFPSIHAVPAGAIRAMKQRWAHLPPDGLPTVAPQSV